MKLKTAFYLVIIFFLFNCNNEGSSIDKSLLIGEWGNEQIIIDTLYNNDSSDLIEPLHLWPFHFGLAFTNDSVDFFYGFDRYAIDTISGNHKENFYKNIVPYELRSDSVFYFHPVEQKWIYLWEIKQIWKDSLLVKKERMFNEKLYRLSYNTIPYEFDRIIYSSSPCFGSCQVISISLDKNGYFIFQGRSNVDHIGLYKGKLSKKNTDKVFQRFINADIIGLKENYSANCTDAQTITTSYIKESKIIKTIFDYGLMAPQELTWAYNRIGNIHNLYKMDTVKNEKLFFLNMNYFSFIKDKQVLRLEDSESFYLLTELRKSSIVENELNKDLDLMLNDYFKGRYNISEIKTDGQFYKFYFADKKSITLDLTYNFIESNFKEDDFKEAESLEE